MSASSAPPGTLALPAQSPPPEHICRIVGFGVNLIPRAMDASGRGHPGRSVHLELTGGGGGTYVVPLSTTYDGAAPTAGVRKPVPVLRAPDGYGLLRQMRALLGQV